MEGLVMIPQNDKTAIYLILKGMVEKGWMLSMVNDGEDEIPVADDGVEEAVEAVTAVDEATVVMYKDGSRGWVYFVLGNEPIEVACNYTVNLDPDLDSIVNPWWQ